MFPVKQFSLLVVFGTCVVWGCAGIFLAQTPSATPQLSGTEAIALKSIQERVNKNNDDRKQIITDVQLIDQDIQKEHPGYHLDLSTMQIVKTEAPKPVESKPVVPQTNVKPK